LNTTLAERIKIIIKEQNLKQSEFADALGVSANYISLLVTGRKNNVSLTFAKLIDALFGYPAKWVLTGEFDENDSNIRHRIIQIISKMPENELLKLEQFLNLFD